jgi:ABC-type transport system involved in multi-copper enzyme maturation permease subunit
MNAIPTSPRTASAASSPAPSLSALIDMELFKLRKRPMTWISAALLLASVSVFVVLGYVLARADDVVGDLEGFLLPNIIPNLFDIISAFGAMLVVVLAASSIGSEFSWGTIRAMVGSGVPRTKLLVAKLLAIVEVIVLLTVAALLTGVITSFGITVAGGHNISFGWINGSILSDVGVMFLMTVVSLFVYAVIGFAVATVTRSLAAGIAVGIGITIAEAILSTVLSAVGGIGETLAKALFSTNLNTLAAWNTFESVQLPDEAPGTTQALLVLTGYTIILLVVAFGVFRTRDIPSGS